MYFFSRGLLRLHWLRPLGGTCLSAGVMVLGVFVWLFLFVLFRYSVGIFSFYILSLLVPSVFILLMPGVVVPAVGGASQVFPRPLPRPATASRC